ncbi:hypothetical protein [Actinomadura xylanilytica]|uniref:hypothetical protein n=1 Tax=Actinomadura xylanilytica TaxID=887459 RepID=UPI00255A89BC|nr:hypothetical protein [Actinomadura xylanilytica]MDL4777174.1 hypothetical protein [Actinomadura xylanilytica]
MANATRMTSRRMATRLVELGMVTEEGAAKGLAAIGEYAPDLDEELVGDDVLDAIDEFGLAVWVHGEDVDDLEEGYRGILREAAALSGGSVVVGDVELVRDADGGEALHFLRNGEPVWWPVEHQPGDCLDQLTIMECIGDLEPGGADPRMFYELPGLDVCEDDVYVLATPEQARALRGEFGLDLEGLDAQKPQYGPPATAPFGTFEWYMQDDARTMSEPAREFLARWTAGMDDALARWRTEFLPQGFPFDFSLASLDALEPLVLDRHPGRDSVIAAGGGPFVEGAVRYIGETLLRVVPSRWGYQDMGLSDAYDRIPMIRSNTPAGFLQTVVPLRRLGALAEHRERGLLAASEGFLRDAVDRHRKAQAARRRPPGAQGA